MVLRLSTKQEQQNFDYNLKVEMARQNSNRTQDEEEAIISRDIAENAITPWYEVELDEDDEDRMLMQGYETA